MTNILLLPGNGCKNPRDALWYRWVMERLETQITGKAILRQFPDYEVCQESIWLPFMKEDIGVNDDFVLIGHSTGAIAATRFAEKYKVKGLVLVSTYHTDLGDELEARSGYFSREWNWSKIQENSDWIVQFSSPSDYLVPIAEQRYVQKHLNSEYYELEGRGHFVDNDDFPELVEVVKRKLM